MMTACLMNNGIVALEHIKKPRQNLLGEQLNSILNLYYSSTDKFYQSLADSSKCSLLIPHEVHFIQFDLSQRMISSGLKDLKIFLDSESTQKATYRCEPSKSLQTNIFFYRFLPLIRGFQIIKTVCAQIHEAYMNNRE